MYKKVSKFCQFSILIWHPWLAI